MATQASAEDRSATYREALASSEFRAVYFGSTLSSVGDYLSKAAVTALVFADTRSAALAAGAFAISYVPWVVGGPVLAAAVTRVPYRSAMIFCDVARFALIGCLAIPGTPVPMMFALLFAASMFDPPFQAARSALLPEILAGDSYVIGVTLQSMTTQAAQVVGYAAGGITAAFSAHAAIALNSATFAVSALFLVRGVRPRPVALDRAQRTSLLRETAAGFVAVFSNPVLRAIALVVFAAVAVSIIPEALGVVWAKHTGHDGFAQGLIMAANPAGYAIGGVVLVRALSPRRRQQLIPLFALVPAACLCVAFTDPPLAGVVVIAGLGGLAMAGVIAPANGLFVQVIAPEFRARAFGVMQGGLQIINGVAALTAGAVAQSVGLAPAVGTCGVIGLAALGIIALRWPDPDRIRAAIDHRAGPLAEAA
jgi:predicted MFS family arabinose efflux permease